MKIISKGVTIQVQIVSLEALRILIWTGRDVLQQEMDKENCTELGEAAIKDAHRLIVEIDDLRENVG
ncbi:hypothetical protein LCGC14_1357590 [marine sediment metagenome]|uniref:Uncharacterized protein n=1 Tax=marine sediment metagenome TaxID=412755 RepID=A0A0F9K911_9ZZZZ